MFAARLLTSASIFIDINKEGAAAWTSISLIHLLISLIHLLISINDLLISINDLLISQNVAAASIFVDINK